MKLLVIYNTTLPHNDGLRSRFSTGVLVVVININSLWHHYLICPLFLWPTTLFPSPPSQAILPPPFFFPPCPFFPFPLLAPLTFPSPNAAGWSRGVLWSPAVGPGGARPTNAFLRTYTLKERLLWHRHKSKNRYIVTYCRYKFHQLFDYKCVHSNVHAYRSTKTE